MKLQIIRSEHDGRYQIVDEKRCLIGSSYKTFARACEVVNAIGDVEASGWKIVAPPAPVKKAKAPDA